MRFGLVRNSYIHTKTNRYKETEEEREKESRRDRKDRRQKDIRRQTDRHTQRHIQWYTLTDKEMLIQRQADKITRTGDKQVDRKTRTQTE